MTTTPGSPGWHMDEREVAAFLDRCLPEADRARIEAHFAQCADCREELRAAHRLLVARARPRRVMAGLAGVAAIAALVVLGRTRTTTGPVDTMRDAGTPAFLVAHGPLGDHEPGRILFAWAPVPRVLTYRLTLSDAAGRQLMTHQHSDTTATLPDSIALRVGATYYWVVDAVLIDGGSRSTGLREFRITR